MDGLSRAVGAGTTIKIKGNTYRLSAMGLKMFGEVEAHILASRADPFAEFTEEKLAEVPKVMQQMLAKEAMATARKGNRLSPQEVADWIDTMEGMAFSFWLCVRDHHPDLDTLEKATTLFEEHIEEQGEEAAADFQRRRDIAAGLDEAGNSTGLDQATATNSTASEERSEEQSPGGE